MEGCKKCKWYDRMTTEGEKRASWKIEELCCNPKTSNCFIPKEKTCERWEEK